MLATKCNVEKKKTKRHATTKRKGKKQMKGSREMTWCAKTEKIKKKAQRDDSSGSIHEL